MTVAPIEAVAGALSAALADQAASAPSQAPQQGAFSRLLVDGAQKVDDDVRAADAMVKAFALDDSIPVHQVTFALEQARLSVELAMQVRARLVEGYQELLRMQL